jgi:hypothetical protein
MTMTLKKKVKKKMPYKMISIKSLAQAVGENKARTHDLDLVDILNYLETKSYFPVHMIQLPTSLHVVLYKELDTTEQVTESYTDVAGTQQDMFEPAPSPVDASAPETKKVLNADAIIEAPDNE